MAVSQMKIPISGGPHTGKTTLIEALKQEFPDAHFVPEPATKVIEQELALSGQNPDYTPRVPWIDYSKFGPLVTQKSVELESEIPESTDLVFQDRSLIDTIAYCKLNNFEEFIPEVRQKIALARYAMAFFCEPVGSYVATHIRRETEDEARKTHEYLAEAYDGAGITVVHLPAVAVEERLEIIRDSI